MEKEHNVTFDWKIKKLKKIAELCVSDDAVHIDQINPTAATGAISELNKMQGHHSAEKHLNVSMNVDTDLQTIQSMMQDLLEKNEKEY